MKVDPATKAMQGSVKGAPQDWRKATFVKALSPVETLLFGVGGGMLAGALIADMLGGHGLVTVGGVILGGFTGIWAADNLF